MSEAVLVDAQFSVAKVFRPFSGFETVYEGLPCTTPIAFPGTLDPSAGKSGYDPNLLAGIPVPLGAKLTLWIPNIVYGPASMVPYTYQILWRLRNLQDFRDPARRAAYHYPKQSLGQSGQYVIPAGIKTILFESAQQQLTQGSRFYNDTTTSTEGLVVGSQGVAQAKTPSGAAAAYQQGLGVGSVGANTEATYNVVQLDAEGDEMIILASRSDAFGATWSFQGINIDAGFSQFYGAGSGSEFPDIGIYVFSGSNP